MLGRVGGMTDARLEFLRSVGRGFRLLVSNRGVRRMSDGVERRDVLFLRVASSGLWLVQP